MKKLISIVLLVVFTTTLLAIMSTPLMTYAAGEQGSTVSGPKNPLGIDGNQDPADLVIKATNKIKGIIWKVATPLLCLVLLVGAIVQKTSFGNQQYIELGRSIRRTGIVGYIIIIAIDVIMYVITGLFS